MPIYGRPLVTVLYKSLPQYRIPFFDALRPRLQERQIDFQLIYGQPDKDENLKQDQGRIEWAVPIDNKIIKIGSKYLFWQPCLQLLKDSDLIIVEQASKLLINYYLILRQKLGGTKIAFWGHGKTGLSTKANVISEAAKRILSKEVHWWFAYNEKSASLVRGFGFPKERITSVQNTIDTSLLMRKKEATTYEDIESLKKSLNIKSENIGIFVGGLYKEKQLPYLLEAALLIKKMIPDFHLIILGSGPDRPVVIEFAKVNHWIRYIGPVFNDSRVPYLMMSKVMLLPGCVGLAIIDSFCTEVPVITVDRDTHGPEIEYLENDRNGVMLGKNASEDIYAHQVAQILSEESKLKELRMGCRKSAAKYSLEEMVERFSDGIEKAIRNDTQLAS